MLRRGRDIRLDQKKTAHHITHIFKRRACTNIILCPVHIIILFLQNLRGAEYLSIICIIYNIPTVVDVIVRCRFGDIINCRVRIYYIGEYAHVREYIICRLYRYNIIIAGIYLQCCTRVHDCIIIMCVLCAPYPSTV